jgi:hypothetical protein
LKKLRKKDDEELYQIDKMPKIKKHKIKLSRIHLSPSMSLITNSQDELLREKQLMLLGKKKSSIKNPKLKKKHTKNKKINTVQQIENKGIKKKKRVNKKKEKEDNKKVIKKVKVKKIKKKNKKISKGTKISMRITFIIMFIILISTIGGYVSAEYLYKENKSNISGLIVIKNDQILSDIIRLEGVQRHQFTIKNQNSYPVTLHYITWDWNPQELSKNIIINWDYDGTIINPGFTRTINLSIISDLDASHELSFNIEFIAMRSRSYHTHDGILQILEES